MPTSTHAAPLSTSNTITTTSAEIKAALRHPQTSSQHTVAALRGLLHPDTTSSKSPPKPSSAALSTIHDAPRPRPRPGPAAKYQRAVAAPRAARTKPSKPPTPPRSDAGPLAVEVRAAVAVEVLNAVLAGLCDALKAGRGSAGGLRDQPPNAGPRVTARGKGTRVPVAAQDGTGNGDGDGLQVLADCGGLALEFLEEHAARGLDGARLREATEAFVRRLVALRMWACAEREIAAAMARLDRARARGQDCLEWRATLQGLAERVSGEGKRARQEARKGRTERLRAFPAALQKLFGVLRSPSDVMDHQRVSECFGEALERLREELRDTSLLSPSFVQEVDLLRRAGLQYWTRQYPSSDDSLSLEVEENLLLCRSIFTACVSALRKFLGTTPKADDSSLISKDTNTATSFSALAMNAIKTVIKALKPGSATLPLTWDFFSAALQDCVLFQAEMERLHQPTDETFPDSQLVHISNLYWHWSTNDRDGTTSDTDVAILSQQMSCNVLEGRPQVEKESGLLVPKLHKLAQCLKSSSKSKAAMINLKQAIMEVVETELFKAVVDRAGKDAFNVIWKEEGMFELGQLLKRWITWSIDEEDLSEEVPSCFDCTNLSHAGRGLILEWQLSAAITIRDKSSHHGTSCTLINDIKWTLLKTYDLKTYPLRRLRVLTRLSIQDENSFEGEGLEEQACDAIEKWWNGPMPLDYCEDRGLARYAQHLRSSFQVAIAFRGAAPPQPVLNAVLSQWSSLIEGIRSAGDLSDHIDDIDTWLSQLQSVSTYFDMQGLELERVKTLNLNLKALELYTRESNTVMTALGCELVRLGYSSRAGILLAKGQQKMSEESAAPFAKMQWHLAHAEYALGLDDIFKCNDHLSKAKLAFDHANSMHTDQRSKMAQEMYVSLALSRSDAFNLSARRYIQTGCLPEALADARKCVKLLQRTWTTLEMREKVPTPLTGSATEPLSDVDAVAKSLQKVIVTTPMTKDEDHQVHSVTGPLFWSLVPKLHGALLLASKMCYQCGMYQEADYYIERARKLCLRVGSDALLVKVLVDRGDLSMRSGHLEQGRNNLNEAEMLQKQFEVSKGTALHQCSLGYLHHLQLHWQGELDAYGNAEIVLDRLTSPDYLSRVLHDRFPNPLTKKVAKSCKAKASAGQIKSQTRIKSNTKPQSDSRRNGSNVDNGNEVSPQETPQLTRLRNEVSRRKAESMLAQGDLHAAAQILDLVNPKSDNMEYSFSFRCTRARQLLLEALEGMMSDPAFSLLNESTLSFPAIARNQQRKSSATGDCTEITQIIQSKRQASAPTPKRESKKSKTGESEVMQSLNLAFESLSDTVSRGCFRYSNSLFSQACSLLMGISMLNSYIQSDSGRQMPPALLAHSLEASKIMVGYRDRKIATREKAEKRQHDLDSWPELQSRFQLDAFGAKDFQTEFVDIIPQDWIVVSLGLSESEDALYMARYESERQPFVIRLPLDRQSSSEAEEGSFTFKDGRMELIDIIQQSDSTIHIGLENPESLNIKGVKTKWWNDREDLDRRLHDLLMNIENMWLGGFSGIFSQQPRCPDLLARFRQTFDNILQKHLPSRQKFRKNAHQTQVNLNAHVFDLFIGLIDNATEDTDLDEPLTDLLYFVVDILQFHGEPNAYDEIDFDAMIVETQDALRSYQDVAKANFEDQRSRHTILNLDKRLHAFPWESLPCLQSKSVSRVLSLVDLKERILAMKQAQNSTTNITHKEISRENGTYILNPSLDLSRTQSRFEKPLVTLTENQKWHSISTRPPTEAEFTSALTPSDKVNVLLYFGHGSGAQYIRNKTITHLSNSSSESSCNVALLFGCSSASLCEAGECEPYGTPRSYMLGGCPALLGSLWNVTDGDCDAFAAGVLERWGLLEKGACVDMGGGGRKKKGKAKQRPPLLEAQADNDIQATSQHMNLSEAVARSRGDCYLKYLNGAAMVVYGIPVALASQPASRL